MVNTLAHNTEDRWHSARELCSNQSQVVIAWRFLHRFCLFLHSTITHSHTNVLSFPTMSYFLPHLPSGWHVDEAIKSEEDRVVVIRFGHDWDSQCMTMDETLYAVAEKVQNFAVIYLCDITEVPDFNKVCFKLFMG